MHTQSARQMKSKASTKKSYNHVQVHGIKRKETKNEESSKHKKDIKYL